MAVTFMSLWNDAPAAGLEIGSCKYLSVFQYLNPFLSVVVGTILVLGILFFLFFLNERFKLLQQTNTLPMLLYGLLVGGVLKNQGGGDVLLAVFLLTFALERFKLVISNINSNRELFDFGFLVALAVLIYPKFIFLIPWSLCSVIFSGRSTLKDVVALCFGWLTPLLFLYFYYFWTDQAEVLPELFWQNVWTGEPLYHFSSLEWIRVGVLLLLLFLSVTHFLYRYSTFMLVHRRFFFALIALLFFLAITFGIVPFTDKSFTYILALPLSWMYAQFLLMQRSKIAGDIWFILLLIACSIFFIL
jgi:hypothetical protein